MKAILKNTEDSQLDILVLDTDNLINSKYYEILEMLESQEFSDEIVNGTYVFYLDDIEYDYSFFLDWLTRDLPELASSTFMNIKIFDDIVNSRLICRRFDGTKFIIDYYSI